MKKKRFIFLAPLALLLTGCNIDIKSSDFTDKLIPNWVSFVVQLAALIVLIVIVFIFAYKPVKKIIKKRQDYIESNIKEAEEAKSRWQENENQSREKVLNSNKEAIQIVSDAKKQAQIEREAILNQTKLDVAKMKLDAKDDIAKMEKEAEEDIKKEIVNVALDASKELLKREVSSKDNTRLVEQFVEEMKK